eukprot:11593422-Ditylum_brightwellii.AAC.1
MNVIYHVKKANSDQSSVYIKEACSGIIAKAIENVSATTRNCNGKPLNLVWAPWQDVTDANCYPYKGPVPYLPPQTVL